MVFSDRHWFDVWSPPDLCSGNSCGSISQLLEGTAVEPIGTVNIVVAELERQIMLLSALLIPLFALIILRPYTANNFLWRSKKVLLVTAHPDDEALFFSPTLLAVPRGVQVFSLCLSYGDSEGLGQVRKEEYHRALDVLKVPKNRRWILNHP